MTVEDNIANLEKILTIVQSIRVRQQEETREYQNIKIEPISVAAGSVLIEEGFEE